MSLYSYTFSHLPPGHQVTADLPDKHFSFPQDVATTDSRPDMVVWSDRSITLIELTIPFESGMEAATLRKKTSWPDALLQTGYPWDRIKRLAKCSHASFDHLYRCLGSSKQELRGMEKDVIKKCIVHSHDIWCRRNWSDWLTCPLTYVKCMELTLHNSHPLPPVSIFCANARLFTCAVSL